MSAHQLKRTIWGQHKGSYKTAWYLSHRIRAAMKEVEQPMLDGTIEMDETYVGGKLKGFGSKVARDAKEIVIGLRQRNGDLRYFHAEDAKSGTLAYYKHEAPRSLITSGGLGTMGFALPAAIGAKVARPEAEVWVVVGDGGFQMTMPELATIVQEKLKVNIAIISNGFLGMVRQWQEFFYERNYQSTPLLNPNFVKLAEAYGIRAVQVTTRREVMPTVEAARKYDGPVLIDFKVEQEDTVYPMVAAGAALHDMIRRPSPLVETAEDA